MKDDLRMARDEYAAALASRFGFVMSARFIKLVHGESPPAGLDSRERALVSLCEEPDQPSSPEAEPDADESS